MLAVAALSQFMSGWTGEHGTLRDQWLPEEDFDPVRGGSGDVPILAGYRAVGIRKPQFRTTLLTKGPSDPIASPRCIRYRNQSS